MKVIIDNYTAAEPGIGVVEIKSPDGGFIPPAHIERWVNSVLQQLEPLVRSEESLEILLSPTPPTMVLLAHMLRTYKRVPGVRVGIIVRRQVRKTKGRSNKKKYLPEDFDVFYV